MELKLNLVKEWVKIPSMSGWNLLLMKSMKIQE